MIGNGVGRVQIWVATAPVDMRKSFDGLAEHVRVFLGHDPQSGNLFVFRNRGGYMLKILWWERTGLTIYYKRLEKGTFCFPATAETALAVDRVTLLRLLSDLSLKDEARARLR